MELRVIIMKEGEPKHSAPKMGREKVPKDQGKGETAWLTFHLHNRGDNGVIIKFYEDGNNIKAHKAIRTVAGTQ